MAGRVTIYDVAAKAGVSISTVSLAMNAPTRVSAATRKKIYDAAEALGFEPKTEAVARARRGVGRIGVLAPFSSYASFGERLNGVLRAVRDQPLEVAVFDLESAAATTSPLLASLPLTGRLDGLIVMGMPLDDSIAERLRDLQMPTVLVEMIYEGFDAVHIDDTAGGRIVAEHLHRLGYQTFGYIGEEQRSHLYVSPSERRLAGFANTLAARGHTVDEGHIVLVQHRSDAADHAATRLLTTLSRPAAIFAHDDVLAAGVLRAARGLGLDVPRDIAIVGFDDSELARALDLTSVRQPLQESGRAAVQLLAERLHDPTRPIRDVSLKLQLMPRATTSPNPSPSPVRDLP